jgi:hypothetical protein
MAAAASRGSLLREINKLSTEILTAKAEVDSSQAKLQVEVSTKQSLVKKIAETEGELAKAEREKAAESSDDTEVVELQRAVTMLTAYRQDLIKATKQARVDRDKHKEDALVNLYTRLGAELEQLRVESSRSAGGSGGAAFSLGGSSPNWDTSAVAAANGSGSTAGDLLLEAETLWKRTSNQGVCTRELLDAALGRADVMLPPSSSSSSSSPSSSSSYGGAESSSSSEVLPQSVLAACTVYEHLPSETLSQDARRSLDTLADLAATANGLQQRIEAVAAPQGAPQEATEAAQATLRTLALLIKQNLDMQRAMLIAIDRSQPQPAPAASASGGGAGGVASQEADGS